MNAKSLKFSVAGNWLFVLNRVDRLSWLRPVGVGGCRPSVCVVSG